MVRPAPARPAAGSPATYASSAGPGRAGGPGRMSQVPTLLSWISTFGSSVMPSRSFAESPVTRPSPPQWYGSQIWCTIRPSIRSGREPVGDQHLGLDRRAGGDDVRPAQVLQPALGGQLRRDLDEHLRLQFRQVRQLPAHAAGGVVLGEPAGGEDVREDLGVPLAAGWG